MTFQFTPAMRQEFTRQLEDYHKIFREVKCDGFHLEEIMVKAIQAERKNPYKVEWSGVNHKSTEDILLTNKTEHRLQIKSGQLEKKGTVLKLSGYRMQKCKTLADKTEFINKSDAILLASPCTVTHDERGVTFEYKIYLVPKEAVTGYHPGKWSKIGKRGGPVNDYFQTNEFGTRAKISPKMSQQVWWEIPIKFPVLHTATF